MHEGKDVPRSSIPAYDTVFDKTSAGYSSDNYWHLTKIDALKAWDATQGSDQFLIGIVDKSFAKNHVDIDGKISEDIDSYWNDLANASPWTADYHGTSVTSVIAANTNNGKGIAGINWNTKLVIGTYGSSGLSSLNTIRSVLDKRKGNLEVLLCNNSWGMAGYIAKDVGDFNPYNPDGTMSVSGLSRQEFAKDASRSYRKAALLYGGKGEIISIFLYGVKKEKLFIWAAGNGNGNGGATNGIYGVDAKFENGAIHLGADGNYSPLDNTIVVAAMEKDGVLASYSAYGQTVDIAAPTGFAAATNVTSTGTSNYTPFSFGGTADPAIFGGTSAAAPVVTGAASLIYSLYPEFTPKQVKEILISSAVEYVTQRYTDPSNTNTQTLARSIPILNLDLAVQEAQKRRSLLSVNPFVNSIHIINNALSVAFSKAINTSTLNASTFTLSGPSGLVSGTVEPNAATFTPSASLADMSTYTVTVTTGVKDLSGNPLTSTYTWSFNTGSGGGSVAPPPTCTPPQVLTNGVCVTPPPATDTTKPIVSSFSVTPGSLTAGSSFTIFYTVSDSGGSGLWQAQLWRAPDVGGVPGTWIKITTTPLSGDGPISGSFTDTPTSGTYWYGVHAVDTAINIGVEPNGAKVVVNPAAAALPTAPNPLAVLAASNFMSLAWNDNSSNETGFKVERKTGVSGSWSQIASVGQNIAAYLDYGVSAGTTYYYRVYAYNASGNSGYSNEVSVTITLADTTLPQVAITSPAASGATVYVSSNSLGISGTASDNVGVAQVAWANDRGGSGVASGTTSWTVSNITLQSGWNTITVTARDAAGNLNLANLIVNYTVAPSAPIERIINGSFTSGISGWTLSGDFWAGTNLTRYYTSPGYASGGVSSAGAVKNYASGYMYQTVTIPSNATSATLSFWLNITSDEPGSAYDYLFVDVLNSSGTLLTTPYTFSNVDKGSYCGITCFYSQKTANLISFKGQTIRIQFRATTDYDLSTVFRIDDVSLMADGN